MPRPLIPPRGVFVPSAVQYDKSIPPAVRDTYSQILGVAYGRPETPPVSFHQLSEDFGKSISTLRGHMAFLRDRGVLRWRTAQDGTIIVSFPKGASKGQAFFRDESADSENLEKPVKEDEDVINSTRRELEPPHPPDSVKRGAKNQKERHFSATVHQALLEAGVFESKLPELAQAGLSDDEIMAIIHKVEDEFGGEQKGGILVHRIQNKVLPPQEYFGEPCSVCGKYGRHTASCWQGMREKYLCPDCGMATCICDGVTDGLSASSRSLLNSPAQHVWDKVLGMLYEQIPGFLYNEWLDKTLALDLDGATLVVGVQDSDTREICESRFASKVSKLLIGILNTADTKVEFVVSKVAL